MRHCCFQFHSGRSGISDERVQKVENTDGAFGGGSGSDLCGSSGHFKKKEKRKKRTHSKSGSRFIKVMIRM